MGHIHDEQVKKMELKAVRIRREIIKMLATAGSGHSAGSLGMADIFTAFYFHVLRHNPKRPDWPDRDRLILSNGHVCPARYAAMAEAGYFPKSWLRKLRRPDSPLQGHPERTRLPGLETTSGPLGAGLAQAAGMAYAAKMDGKRWHTFCLTSDGEHDAGSHWEAVMFAGNRHLDNLTCVIDRNNIQIDGTTEIVMPLEPLMEKYEIFNWHVIEVDGNDLRQVVDAIHEAKAVSEQPTAIIAHTIPGHGVDFMEGDYRWHGRAPDPQQAKRALDQLDAYEKGLRADH
ncbi:transketolase [Parcubacteria bacterium SG8_24]|nr:MAG: transketolase [Parcubacteria bacterium SG8_24]